MVDICHWWIHHFNWATKNAPEKHPDSVMRQKAAHAVKPIDAKDISSYLPKCWLPFSDWNILCTLLTNATLVLNFKNKSLGFYPEEKASGRSGTPSMCHTWFRTSVVAPLDHVNDKIVCRLQWNVKCFSLILLSLKLSHSTSSLAGVWSAPDRRNRCCAGCPPLKGTYCWGLEGEHVSSPGWGSG